jgi:hypothetical protein
MSRGCFLILPSRLRTFRVNFVRTHHACASDQNHMISSRRFFFPESCVRQFAETSRKETFTAWASKRVSQKAPFIVQVGVTGYRLLNSEKEMAGHTFNLARDGMNL